MRENRTYGSEGGEPVMDNSPTPIMLDMTIVGAMQSMGELFSGQDWGFWVTDFRLNPIAIS